MAGDQSVECRRISRDRVPWGRWHGAVSGLWCGEENYRRVTRNGTESAAWMKLAVHAVQAFLIDVGVDLRGGQGGVAEQLLDDP